MIDLYTWKTPNGRKIPIMLEETGLPYQVHPIDISQKQQFTPEYLAINPNNKIPAIVDTDGTEKIVIFESGAILIYLAEKTGKFLPANGAERYHMMQWLMFQMSGLGPMLGQLNHFRGGAPEKIPYAINRYETEAKRLFYVLNTHLEKSTYLAAAYSIADMACFPWIAIHERYGIDLNDYLNVKRWYENIAQRPAVQRGMQIP